MLEFLIVIFTVQLFHRCGPPCVVRSYSHTLHSYMGSARIIPNIITPRGPYYLIQLKFLEIMLQSYTLRLIKT